MGQIWKQIEQTTQYLKSLGIEIPQELKRRDKREPGRKQKELAEEKLYRFLQKYFREQKARIEQKLSFIASLSGKSLADSFLGNDFWQLENERTVEIIRLVALLRNSAVDGIRLFGEGERIGLDYSLANSEAAVWANDYAFELIKGINSTTRDVVSKAVTDFINTPGSTLADLVSSLPFSEERSWKIAVTETTRAYAQGNQLAGEQLKQEFPNVEVVKIWFTNSDDRVCPICAPLDGVEVPLNKSFSKGIDMPPAHINCRCWTTTSTRLK